MTLQVVDGQKPLRQYSLLGARTWLYPGIQQLCALQAVANPWNLLRILVSECP